MKEKTTGVVMLPIGQLHPHPDNPRKDLGDLTELEKSIRENGILQNLTVIPDDDSFESFTVLIGHRRLAAAKQIGYISKLPCSLMENCTRTEQIAIMLEENMQRNDLTFLEQAQSFQLMLDLGQDVEQIANTTGFSETTVRHRLEIAKLDPELVADRQADENYQFTLTDYIKLEKVPDNEVRNRILAEAKSTQDIEWKINTYMNEARMERNRKAAVDLMHAAGLKKTKESRWGGNVETVKSIDLRQPEDQIPEEIALPEDPDAHYRYTEEYGVIHIIKDVKRRKKSKEEQEADTKRKQMEENYKKCREMQKEWEVKRKTFVKDLIAGHYTLPKKEAIARIENDIWALFMRASEDPPGLYPYASIGSIADYLMPSGDRWNNSEEWKTRKILAKNMRPLYQKIILADEMLKVSTGTDRAMIMKRYGERNEEMCDVMAAFYGILERLGFQTEEEVLQILRGDSDLFGKEDAWHTRAQSEIQ